MTSLQEESVTITLQTEFFAICDKVISVLGISVLKEWCDSIPSSFPLDVNNYDYEVFKLKGTNTGENQNGDKSDMIENDCKSNQSNSKQTCHSNTSSSRPQVENVVNKVNHSLYHCNFCSKCYRSESLLKRHLQLHSKDNRLLICFVCDKKFKEYNELQLHQIVHTVDSSNSEAQEQSDAKERSYTRRGERPYLCTMCDMTFARKTVLSKHMKCRHPMNELVSNINRLSVKKDNSCNERIHNNQKQVYHDTQSSLNIEVTEINKEENIDANHKDILVGNDIAKDAQTVIDCRKDEEIVMDCSEQVIDDDENKNIEDDNDNGSVVDDNNDNEQVVHDNDEVVHDNDKVVHDNEQVVHDNEQVVHDNDEVVHDNDKVVHDNEQVVHDNDEVVHATENEYVKDDNDNEQIEVNTENIIMTPQTGTVALCDQSDTVVFKDDDVLQMIPENDEDDIVRVIDLLELQNGGIFVLQEGDTILNSSGIVVHKHEGSENKYLAKSKDDIFLFPANDTINSSEDIEVEMHDGLACQHKNKPKQEVIPSLWEEVPCARTKRIYQCHICSKLCGSSSGLTLHIKYHNTSRPTVKAHLCLVCGKTFKEAAHLRRHQTVHTGERRFVCTICGKSYTDTNGLKFHYQKHAGIKPYECVHCNKRFPQNSSLVAHTLRTHNLDECPYVCTNCGKKCALAQDLRIHETGCKGERPFSCRHCEKKFTTAGNLQKHQRVHSGERPYACSICDKKFSQVSCVKEHIRQVHHRDRPFKCSNCNRAFPVHSELIRHSRVHSRQQVHNCMYCQKTFKNLACLQTHIEKHMLTNTLNVP